MDNLKPSQAYRRPMTGQPAVFVDRDGVINRRTPWIYLDPTKLDLLPGAADALARLSQHGYLVVVVTNQPWVGYGLVDLEDLEAFHERIRERVRAHGGSVDDVQACTHRHTEHCECRKPGTAMLEDAARRLDVDREASWMVGDKPSDVEAGRAFGARTVHVTGERLPWERLGDPPEADENVETLAQAVDRILETDGPA